MTLQLSMFDIFEPKPVLPRYEPPARRIFEIETCGRKHAINILADDPDPQLVEVRGTPCIMTYGHGWATRAAEPAGSLFWSETGYRSMGYALCDHRDTADMIAAVERYIDGPTKNGNGCGGKLVRWWPSYALQWAQSLAFILEYGRDRSKLWDHFGPEGWAATWAKKDRDFEADLARMYAEGIDPNEVGRPLGYKGHWPKFTPQSTLVGVCGGAA